MRLLAGIAALTVICMFAVAVVTDHLADICLSSNPFSQTSHIHLINEVTQALKRAQDDRKAYLATGQVSYLDSYHLACADVDESMDRLVNEDNEVANKLAHAQGLRAIVHDKLSEIARALESKPVAVHAPDPMPTADSDLNRIQRLLDALGQEESRDVSGVLDDAHSRTTFHRNLVAALAVINIFFLGGVTLCAIQIRKLHSLVTMCAWSKRVQYKGQWIPLEEYMRKRFGVRISHGISEEEYDKWSDRELVNQTPPAEAPKQPGMPTPPKPTKATA
jgi:hypothetical protein